MKGQLSAEMLILLMLIIGLVVIVYTQMNNSVNKIGKTVQDNTDTVTQAGKARLACENDEDCKARDFDRCYDKYCQ